MAYASKFNPDALPAHAEPEEAAQILSRRPNASNPASPNPGASSSSPPPRKAVQTDYYNKPPPPLPVQTSTPNPSQQPYHRNTLSGSQQPPQRIYSPAVSPKPGTGPNTPASLQAGFRQPQTQPQNQNLGPQGYQRRASTPSNRSSDAALYPLFNAVDSTGTGQLSEAELSQALMNGDYTTFDPATVRMMIRMHDHDNNGTIGFEEFCALWNFLASWRVLFDKFDEDSSGYISFPEYSNALVQFGYNLTPQFVIMLFRLYEKGNRNGLSFDLFVQSCLTLKRLTDVFKRGLAIQINNLDILFIEVTIDTKSTSK